MQSVLLVIILVSSLFAVAHAQTPEPRISPAAIRADVAFLADDALAGRVPGTRGYQIAAHYVAKRFEEAGLEPAGDNDHWYQSVHLQEQLLAEDGTGLTISGPDGTARWAHGSESIVFPSPLKPVRDVKAPVVFAGFGLDAPGQGFTDYQGLDVRGKIVVVLSGTPKGTPSEIGAHLAARKPVMAERRGAIGIIAVSTLIDQRLFPWERQLENGTMPRMAWVGASGHPSADAPGVHAYVSISPAVADTLFAGADRSLDAVLEEADREGGRPEGFALPARARIQWTGVHRTFTSPNVLALIPGSDPQLRHEVVLVIAHLDHVGTRSAKDGDVIVNGAMDNAAGVAVMLEVARAIANSDSHPRRSILFLAATAEETGLLGTRFFAAHPPIPLDRIVGVINLDVPILTYDFVDVIAFGAKHSTLGAVAAQAAAAAGAVLSPDPMPAESLFTRSDHYVLVRKGVPALFLTTGHGGPGEKAWTTYLADHYHQPSDDVSQPFNWQAAARFARITRLLATGIANEAVRPRWYEDDFFGDTFAPSASKAPKPAAVKGRPP